MQLQQGRARQHGTHEVLWHDAHEFDHKGCIIVEEEAQAGGDQREEDLRPAAQVQALLEAPGKKNTNCRGFQVFFWEKMSQLERSN